MRTELLNTVRTEITKSLTSYLLSENITLYIAANDNIPPDAFAVILEGIESTPIFTEKLITEIRVILGVLGKPSQCEAVIEGLYNCLHPYRLTLPELNVLLMSMHIESSGSVIKRRIYKKAVMRYMAEEEKA